MSRAETAFSPDREVVVYLKTAPAQRSELVASMRREAEALLAPAGFSISWRDLAGSSRDTQDAFIALIQFRGICETPAPGVVLDSLADGASLASTAVSDGKVLPYSELECENLSKLVAASLEKETPDKRDLLYGRAMGRLVAHELYHVLSGARDHDAAGIAKRGFSAQDILADHFEFQVPALDKFRDSPNGSTDESLDRRDRPR